MRHPEYRRQRQRTLDVERKRAHDPVIVRQWFGMYDREILQRVDPSDIYNFDETGF
jgi:hypothetical protein